MVESIAIAAVLLTCLLAFAVYNSAMHFMFKAAVFPLLIVVSLLGWRLYVDRLGAPIDGPPKNGFTYVFHTAGNGGEVIFLWVKTREIGQRLHVLPYSRELMKELEEAKKEGTEGEEAAGHIVKQEQGFTFVRHDVSEIEGNETK